MLKRWLSEIKRTRPKLYVTFNGDFFDWLNLNDLFGHQGFLGPSSKLAYKYMVLI